MSEPAPTLGAVVQSFFADHLITVKGLRPASVRIIATETSGLSQSHSCSAEITLRVS